MSWLDEVMKMFVGDETDLHAMRLRVERYGWWAADDWLWERRFRHRHKLVNYRNARAIRREIFEEIPDRPAKIRLHQTLKPDEIDYALLGHHMDDFRPKSVTCRKPYWRAKRRQQRRSHPRNKCKFD